MNPTTKQVALFVAASVASAVVLTQLRKVRALRDLIGRP